MKDNIKAFSSDFVRKLSNFVAKIKREEEMRKDLTTDEVKAVITETFYLLGKNHEIFRKRAKIK